MMTRSTKTPANNPASCGVERALPLSEAEDFTLLFSSLCFVPEATNKIKITFNFPFLVYDLNANSPSYCWIFPMFPIF